MFLAIIILIIKMELLLDLSNNDGYHYRLLERVEIYVDIVLKEVF